MSKKQKGPGDDVARALSILNKPIEDQITECVGKIEQESDFCYCEGPCDGHMYITGRDEAVEALTKLFRQYL